MIYHSVKGPLTTKVAIQNKPAVAVVRGPVAALRLFRDLFYSVFSYAEQFIGGTVKNEEFKIFLLPTWHDMYCQDGKNFLEKFVKKCNFS